jgi:hypothetical protein
MKMVKSLLLGSAASLVAMAGAQGAELPVKAKPVEYVKVCSLYGAGFFYIPGTDTCIKLGGAIRVQAEYNAGAGGIPYIGGSSAIKYDTFNDFQDQNPINQRTRIYFSVDVRQQTDYGTLRSYARFGVSQTTPSDPVTGTAFFDRAFIQFAGFTVGKTVSFFDGITFADINYNNPRTLGDSGAVGITVWAFTAQLGNGISATMSAEDPCDRGLSIGNLANAGSWTVGSTVGSGASGSACTTSGSNLIGTSFGNLGNGWEMPDFVGALRIDQAWGSAQVMGAVRLNQGSYFNTSGSSFAIFNTAGTLSGIPALTNGHPDSELGWAVGASVSINLPTFGAQGDANSQPNVDQFRVQGVYSEGAGAFTTNGIGAYSVVRGQNMALGYLQDSIYGTIGGVGSNMELTTAWSVDAAYQHIWTPNWRTSVYGGYLGVSYDSTATAMICGVAGSTSTLAATPFSVERLISGSCNPDFSVWQVGTRTQWNPVSQLDVGVDVLYSSLNSASNGSVITVTAPFGAHQAGLYTLDTEGVWSVMFRVQRNFWP